MTKEKLCRHRRSNFATVNVIAVLLSCFAAGLCAQPRSIEEKVDEYISPYLQMGSFSGSILIAGGGEILFSKGYGYANLEQQIPNSPDTRFQIGSLGKQFVAAAIMRLQESGLLSVGDPVTRFLPDYRYGSEMTIHHLLCHTSGLPTDLPDGGTGIDSGLRDRLNNQRLLFEPGSQYNYSNVGYQLLYLIVYGASGIHPEQYISRNIFEPLGMTDTVIDTGAEIEAAATGYVLGFSGPRDVADYAARPLGTRYATTGDLLTWVRGMVGTRVLSRQSVEAMLTPNLNSYGYAWIISEHNGQTLIRHGGRMPGFSCALLHLIESDITVVILGNVGNYPTTRIGDDLLAIATDRPYVIPTAYEAIDINPREFRRYVGRYRADDGSEIIIANAREFLVLIYIPEGARPDDSSLPRYTLYPYAEHRFFCKNFDGQLEFRQFFDGTANLLLLTYNGDLSRYSRQ